MKKRIFALFLIVLLLFSAGCQKATLENYKLFRSTPLGFSMEYPSFWSKSSDNAGGVAVFLTPTEGYSDDYNESVSVQRFELDMEGEDAYNNYVKGYVGKLESTLKNYKLISEEDITLGGQPAYKIVYESIDATENAKNEMRFMQIFAQQEKDVYVITYMAEFSGYSYFLTNVEEMISTFKFI
ncbi:MAG: hypothetical protein IKM48_04370 [Clostridia bacterium]|nr:hypothetical protein [Clostridia bacterium]